MPAVLIPKLHKQSLPIRTRLRTIRPQLEFWMEFKLI